jgi:hypothetical protein
LLPYAGGRKKERQGRDPGGSSAMLLTTVLTVAFIGASSVILWLAIGAD